MQIAACAGHSSRRNGFSTKGDQVLELCPCHLSTFILCGGLEPAGSGGDDREGAALRSKSWLALQDSPSNSKASSSSHSDLGGSTGKSPVSRRTSNTPQSPLAPARSAALQPVSSPATAYGSDDELVSSPAFGSPVVSRSGASSGTCASAPDAAAEASPGTWPAASPQPLPMQKQNCLSPVRGARPSAFAAASPVQQERGGKWAAYDGHAKGPTAEAEPAAEPAATPQRLTGCAAVFTYTLAATSALRAVLAVAFAAACFLGAPQLVAAAWLQAAGAPPPFWHQAQRLPPLAVLAGVELSVMLLAYALANPEQVSAAQPQAGGVVALASRAVAMTAPRLHRAVSFLVPLYQQLWQVSHCRRCMMSRRHRTCRPWTLQCSQPTMPPTSTGRPPQLIST